MAPNITHKALRGCRDTLTIGVHRRSPARTCLNISPHTHAHTATVKSNYMCSHQTHVSPVLVKIPGKQTLRR